MTNLIKNKKFTRIMAILLVVLIAFSTMFTLPVSAASGDKVTIIVMTARAIQSNFSRQLSAMVTRSELPAKNCARFLQTEKKPTALNPVTAFLQAIH